MVGFLSYAFCFCFCFFGNYATSSTFVDLEADVGEQLLNDMNLMTEGAFQLIY